MSIQYKVDDGWGGGGGVKERGSYAKGKREEGN